MSKKVQLRRGTTEEHSTFIGAVGEITVDTTKNTAVVHDGVTAGGKPLVKEESVGTAATRDVGVAGGNVMEVGAFGFGGTTAGSIKNVFFVNATAEELQITQMIQGNNDGATGYGTGLYWRSGVRGHALVGGSINNNLYHAVVTPLSENPASRVITRSIVRTAANTTVDSNGFLKNASPIIQLFADKIEINDEAQLQEIVFEKLGVGDYLIKNSTGLSNDGWYIEQPRDANGNIYHAVVHEQLESGDISIKTYECKLNEIGQTVADLEKPIDIKENRFITLRLNELPQDTTAPQNPNVVDSVGNPSPSKYHVLENGVWVISNEDAEILADEKYQAYLQSLRPLTRRQFKLTLLENGLLDHIENSISAIEDDQMRARIQIEYAESTDFHRTSDSVAHMCQLLGLTNEQVDQMWEQAMSL